MRNQHICALICVPTNARARSRRRTHGHGRGCWVGTRTRRWAFDRRRRLDDLRGCGRHLVLVLRSLLTLMTRREWSTWCRARQAAGRRSEWQWAAATPHGDRCLCLEHNLQDKRAKSALVACCTVSLLTRPPGCSTAKEHKVVTAAKHCAGRAAGHRRKCMDGYEEAPRTVPHARAHTCTPRPVTFRVSCCRSVEMRRRLSRCSGYALVTCPQYSHH